MARPKKVKEEKIQENPVIENPVEEAAPETVVEETATVVEEVVPEPEPIVEKPIVEPEVLVDPEPVKVEVPETPVLRKENDQSLTMEDRLEAFVEARSSQMSVKLNDFLKSLLPAPKFNEPPAWLEQGANKKVKLMLTTMQAEGKLTVRDNSHLRLGTAYYPDSTTLKTHYHNLNSVVIEVAPNCEK